MKNISTKELNYINDLLSWELLCSKKCYQYACQENGSQHSKVFSDAAQTHKSNYTALLNHLNSIQAQNGGQIQ